MASALRCRLDGVDFVQDYNHFVRVNRPALTGAVDDLRIHFDEGDGWRPSLERFDRYVTAIANEHGRARDYSCRDLRLITEDGIDARGDARRLLDLSRAVGVTPRFTGGVCETGGRGDGWRTRWAASAAASERAPALPPVVTSVGGPEPAAATPPQPAVVEEPALASLPVTKVAEAPIAEPQASDAPEPVAVAAAAPEPAAPTLQPAVATRVEPVAAASAPTPSGRAATFDLASGSLTVPEGGEVEVVVTEGPEQNGVRSRTYRIRRPGS
ncbi:hypothetical protein GGR88_000890 [Sphingomonas jejuensis]|uniref:Uncharacterized protein n=1 Tax=Sphingomonas jejuensis TaxID=904715 RepID=A0ABX0XJB3_9SPHN|nr:hypothetical protein [Sphingomonas jejuensis]NJC33416.1 hypothetical protein [Sphingomonas jejuensis]